MLTRLRPQVEVTQADSDVMLRSPMFEISLPKAWVDGQPTMRALLAGEYGNYITRHEDVQLRDVITLLIRLGGITVPNKDTFTFREARFIFDTLRADWYSDYYKHPLWSKLRNGTLSRNALLCWLIHNYHISRAAGITDARAAVSMPSRRLREFFQENSLEEFWHCEAFYFVHHPNLAVSDDDVKQYVPLRSSIAFEQLATRLAEDDWIANVFISYFQESSIAFYEDCLEFYQEVESHYDIPGFFKPWVKHMGLDFEHSHADVLGELFDTDEVMSRERLLAAFTGAYRAYRHLMNCLDEIVATDLPDQSVKLRKPVRGRTIVPTDSTLLDGYTPNSTYISGDSAHAVYESLQQTRLSRSEILDGSRQAFVCSLADAAFLRTDLLNTFFRSLGFATEHDEAILFGKLAEKATSLIHRFPLAIPDPSAQPVTLAATVLANFLNAVSTRPSNLAFLLLHLCELYGPDGPGHNAYLVERDADVDDHGSDVKDTFWLPIGFSGKTRLIRYLSSISVTATDVDKIATQLFQLNEILVAWHQALPESEVNFLVA